MWRGCTKLIAQEKNRLAAELVRRGTAGMIAAGGEQC
jgi:hypothetical protein